MNIEMLTAVVVFGGLLAIAIVGLTLSNRQAERGVDHLRPRPLTGHPADVTAPERNRADQEKFPPIPS